jgi:geranylgeranyl pyrophosphate synthase
LREIYGRDASGPMSQPEVEEVLAILERSGAHAEALAQARRYREEALSDLEGLPLPPERRAELRFLLESVITI